MGGFWVCLCPEIRYWQEWCSNGTTSCLGTCDGTLAIASIAVLSSGFFLTTQEQMVYMDNNDSFS